MKSLYKISLATMMALGAGTASAAIARSSTNIYFDENGVMVGQQLILCTNIAHHGGNIHTAYFITETFGCGTNPPPKSIVPGTSVNFYVLPSFLPIATACVPAECDSTFNEPHEIISQGWTFDLDWQ